MWDDIVAWEQHLHHAGVVAPPTQHCYTQDARRFATWAQSVRLRSLSDITLRVAWRYDRYLLEHHYAPTTILRAMKSLAAWLTHQSPRQVNPFRTLLAWHHLHDLLDHVLTHDEQSRLLRIADQRGRHDAGMSGAILSLLWTTGWSIERLLALRQADIVFGTGKARIHDTLVRQWEMDLQGSQALRSYLAYCHAQVEQHDTASSWCHWPDGPLWMGQRGPLTHRSLRLILTSLAHDAHVEAPLTQTVMQATFMRQIFAPQVYGCTWPLVALHLVHEWLDHEPSSGSVEVSLPWFLQHISASDAS